MIRQKSDGQIKAIEMASLLRQVQNILEIRAKVPRQAGTAFNIFSILNKERDEVNTHCRVLYELLNPDGSHGMGDQFLREFFSVIEQPYPGKNAVTVSREFSFPHGRIDLLIEGADFCFPIEVKIGAGDQDTQVKRYAEFARQRAEKSRVYYLTLTGYQPSDYSTGTDSALNLTAISFSDEIRRWLLRCGELSWTAPSVSEIVRQYIALLDKLTGRTGEDGFVEMVRNLVGSSRANYESAEQIAAAIPYVRADMMAAVLREIKEHLDSRLGPADFFNYEEESAAYYTKRGYHSPFMTYPIAECGELILSVEAGIGWYLYIGLGLYDKEGQFMGESCDALPSMFAHERWKSWLCSLNHEEGYSWWKPLPEETPLDFKNCGGLYPELYDTTHHTEIMREICSEMDAFLENLREMGVLPVPSPK